MTDNPCNCSTCSTIKCYHHPNHWKTTSQCWSRNDHAKVWEFTKEHGCISHPKAREYLIKGVIEELENRAMGADAEEDYVAQSLYSEAIALIKEGAS